MFTLCRISAPRRHGAHRQCGRLCVIYAQFPALRAYAVGLGGHSAQLRDMLQYLQRLPKVLLVLCVLYVVVTLASPAAEHFCFRVPARHKMAQCQALNMFTMQFIGANLS
jgi:hypothetical protein